MVYALMIAGVWAVLIVMGLIIDWFVQRWMPNDTNND